MSRRNLREGKVCPVSWRRLFSGSFEPSRDVFQTPRHTYALASLLNAAPNPSCHRGWERCRMKPAPSLKLDHGDECFHPFPKTITLVTLREENDPPDDRGACHRSESRECWGSLPHFSAVPLVHASLGRGLQTGEHAPFVSSLASPRTEGRSSGGRLVLSDTRVTRGLRDCLAWFPFQVSLPNF